METDGNGQWQHTNVWANGQLIGTYDGQGLHFHFDDPLGTRRLQASSSGTVEATYLSLPYGDGFSSTGTDDPTENHFTGKERDAESGNDYMFARYYNSATGRFLSPDWDAKSSDPVPYAKLGDPQTLNLYSYVRNSPVVAVDLNGHCAIDGAHQEGGCSDLDSENARKCEDLTCDDTKRDKKSPAQQNNASSGGLTPAQLQKIKKAAMQIAAKDAKTFAKGIPGFSLKTFDSELQNAIYVQDPHGTNGSVEASTVSTGPMSGRSTQLYADFFSDTPERQAGVLVHENIHRYTGWTDSNVFYQFQHLGMTSGEVHNFTSFGNTDGITTWILRMAK